jgi:hypothetical protein
MGIDTCTFDGWFEACTYPQTREWAMTHNIVSVFPDYKTFALHDLCLRDPTTGQTIVATVYDECPDLDCAGCCTQAKGNADELLDVESSTYARFNMRSGVIDWADLGPSADAGCD